MTEAEVDRMEEEEDTAAAVVDLVVVHDLGIGSAEIVGSIIMLTVKSAGNAVQLSQGEVVEEEVDGPGLHHPENTADLHPEDRIAAVVEETVVCEVDHQEEEVQVLTEEITGIALILSAGSATSLNATSV